MTSLERTIRFIEGKAVDKVPFHPLVMQFAAAYAGVSYRDYCLDYGKKCDANLKTAEDFGIDWMHVGGHPYTEAEDYGLVVEYPENSLPLDKGPLISSESDFAKVRLLDIEKCRGMMGRVEGVALCFERAGDYMPICGWAEGPMAEYADLRGLSGACMDLVDHGPQMKETLTTITENIRNWITLQGQAGAQLFGIGDAACSQIGPRFYREFIFDHHKDLVAHIHSLGAYADFHICGNTAAILPMVIETGVNMIDVDYLVEDVGSFAAMLGPRQVIRGTCDPVGAVQNGTPETIEQVVIETARVTGGKCMVAAGCEIPLDTPHENLKAMSCAAHTVTSAQYGVRSVSGGIAQ
ncbi:MAG: uroporphyrinogen decarboxylase family protein [Gammaproteobacteria bacterium]